MNKFKVFLFITIFLSVISVSLGCQRATTYTVTFDSNGGTKVKTQEVKENEKVEEPKEPTKEGYDFKGWYLNSKKYDFDKKVTKDLKLKAKWIKIAEEEELSNETTNTIYNNYYLPVTNTNTNVEVSKPVVEEIVKKDAEVELEIPSTSSVGVATEFTLSLTANDYAETPVYGMLFIESEDEEEPKFLVEYFDEEWHELTTELDEPFPLEDTEGLFRITFQTKGTYDFHFALIDAETITDEIPTILAETKASTTVEMKEAEIEFELPEVFYVGEAAEFKVSTIANSYAGTMVVGTGGIANEDVLEKLEYLEGETWYELPKGTSFGPATGFELKDAESTFRATFNTAGEYEVTFKVVSAEDESNILAETTTTITVEMKEAEIEFELPEVFYVGEAAEFKVSTIANSYAGTMVVGTGGIANEDVLEKLEYLEGETWYELPKGTSFGPATGFELKDAESTFRATFNTAGEYEVTFKVVSVEDESNILAETTTTITVEMKEAEIEFELPEVFYVGEAAEFKVSTIANSYAGTMVVGTGGIANEDVLEKLEYLEGETWYELPKGTSFGPATGFELKDAESTFRATFNTAGEYEVTFKVVDAEDESNILAETTTTITVEEKAQTTTAQNE